MLILNCLNIPFSFEAAHQFSHRLILMDFITMIFATNFERNSVQIYTATYVR